MSNQDKMEQAITELAEDSDMQELVQNIQSASKTTAGNYGRYLSLLSNIKDENIRHILAQAFIRAGADAYGVNSAMKIIG